MRQKWLFAAVLCMILGLAGCQKEEAVQTTAGQQETKEENTTAAQADAEYKDTMIVAISGDPGYEDPQNNTSNDRIMRMVYDMLVRRTEDNQIVPGLAESWEQSEDGLTWTFYLRKGVKFHNGKEFTARDVKATYDRLTNTDEPLAYTSSFLFLDSTNIIDDYTVEFKLKEPFAPFLATFCGKANMILDADIIEKYGRDLGRSVEATNGTGPYRLESRIKDQEVNMTANEDYYNGAPYIKHLQFLVIKEESARAIALETGQVDMTVGMSPDEIVRLGSVDGIRVERRDSNGQYYFMFNYKHPIISDVKVRQAMNYAIDHQAIIDAIWAPVGYKACTSVMSPLTWGYTDLGVIERDLDKAKELLAEAGYPAGFTFKAAASTAYAKNAEVMEIVAAQLAEVGITAEIEVLDSPTFSSMQGRTPDQFEYGLICYGTGPGSADAHEALMRTFGTSLDGTNSGNIGFYSNAELDQLIADGAKELDEEKRMAIYKRAQEIMYLEDPCGIWINDLADINIVSDKVEGYSADVRGVVAYHKIKIRK